MWWRFCRGEIFRVDHEQISQLACDQVDLYVMAPFFSKGHGGI